MAVFLVRTARRRKLRRLLLSLLRPSVVVPDYGLTPVVG